MKLNRLQRKAGLIGLGVVVAMSLFPPVVLYETGGSGIFNYHIRSHRFLLQSYKSIRFETLFKRMFVVGIATGGAVVFLKNKDKDDDAR